MFYSYYNTIGHIIIKNQEKQTKTVVNSIDFKAMEIEFVSESATY